jgi:inosine/xanthosine triphosphatase
MKVAVGSKNPAKIAAVQEGFQFVQMKAEVLSIDIESGVSSQPFSDEETIRGAIQRAERSLKAVEDAQVGIGLEGGVAETPQGLLLCNWGALAEVGKEPLVAGGARILLPEEIAEKLRAGEELGPVMDEFCRRKQIREKEGAIGIFTDGLVTRKDMFFHVMKLLIGQWLYRKKRW